MGRKIRRVPKGWQHPKWEEGQWKGQFKAMHDQTFEDAAKEWWENAVKWHNGEVQESDKEWLKKYPWYWQWNGDPPDADYYRPAFTAPADCFQIYQTVSEGTPTSPVFDSLDDMIEWMIQPIDHSSEYNCKYDELCMQGMTREQATKFCKNGWAPSGISTPETGFVVGHRA